MISAMLIAAAGGNPFPNIMQYVIKALAAIGGGVVGAIVIALLVQLLTKGLLHRSLPKPMVVVVRVLGGLTMAVAVWMGIQMGPGTGGFSLWSGGGDGTDGTPTNGPKGTGLTFVTTSSKDKEQPPKPERGVMIVEMLGGKRYKNDERFYLVDSKKPARTLTETMQAIQTRQKADAELKAVEIVMYDIGSVAEDHSAVRDLKKQVQDLGLEVKTASRRGSAPD